jgi:hypothetical protein
MMDDDDDDDDDDRMDVDAIDDDDGSDGDDGDGGDGGYGDDDGGDGGGDGAYFFDMQQGASNSGKCFRVIDENVLAPSLSCHCCAVARLHI